MMNDNIQSFRLHHLLVSVFCVMVLGCIVSSLYGITTNLRKADPKRNIYTRSLDKTRQEQAGQEQPVKERTEQAGPEKVGRDQEGRMGSIVKSTKTGSANSHTGNIIVENYHEDFVSNNDVDKYNKIQEDKQAEAIERWYKCK